MATAAQTPTRIFKSVPLDPSWALPGTKLDLKAIYRRPRRSSGEYDEVIHERGPDGLPLFDIIGPLPMRRHSDWIAKGYEYVTVVASPHVEGSGWGTVAGSLRAKGLNPQEYLQHPTHGTWNPKLYLASATLIDADKYAALTALVEELGSKTVLAVRQSTDPTFTLPPHLMDIPAGGKVKTLRTDVPANAKPGTITDQAGYDQAKAEGRIAEIPAKAKVPAKAKRRSPTPKPKPKPKPSPEVPA